MTRLKTRAINIQLNRVLPLRLSMLKFLRKNGNFWLKLTQGLTRLNAFMSVDSIRKKPEARKLLKLGKIAQQRFPPSLRKTLTSLTPLTLCLTPVPVVPIHSFVSLRACAVLLPTPQVRLLKFPSGPTTVKVSISLNITSPLVVHVKVLRIPHFVLRTQVTSPAVLLTFHRTLLFVRRTAVVRTASMFTIYLMTRKRRIPEKLLPLKSALQADIFLRTA